MLGLIRRGASGASYLMCIGAGIALALTTVHIFFDALSTKFLHAPIGHTHDMVTRYYMVTLFFLPLAQAELRNRHITADLLFTAMPIPVRVWLVRANALLLVVYVGLMTWQATVKAISMTARGEKQISLGVEFLIWPSRWIEVVGLAALLIVALLKLLEPARPRAVEVLPHE